MNIKQLFIGIFLQTIGLKYLWQFKLLFKYFPESAKCNILHEYFGTKYRCWFYDSWTMCIEITPFSVNGRIIWWYIERFEDLPSLYKKIRKP